MHKEGKSWTIHRKYKSLCDFHTQIKAILPGMHLSEYSFIVNPQEGSKKSLLIEERRKILEKYLKDLCSNPHVTQSSLWKEFIDDQTESFSNVQVITSPESKLAVSELVRSNIMCQLGSPDK